MLHLVREMVQFWWTMWLALAQRRVCSTVLLTATLGTATILKMLASAVQIQHVRQWNLVMLLPLLLILALLLPALCQNGDVQLVNGSTAYSGRVEICFHETWGTICDNMWSATDANVVCRQLGFSRHSEFIALICFKCILHNKIILKPPVHMKWQVLFIIECFVLKQLCLNGYQLSDCLKKQFKV